MDFMNNFSIVTTPVSINTHSVSKILRKKLNLAVCNICRCRWFNLEILEDISCIAYHKFDVKNELNIFSKANNMDPGSQTDVLKKKNIFC